MNVSQKKSEKREKNQSHTTLFIICSGADKGIIEDCPTEWNKYTGIGATIFFTAVLASLSGGYAIHFAFESIWVSAVFGLLWGLVIFNLDRNIVLSMKKEEIPTKEEIEKQTDDNKKRFLKSKKRRLKYNAFNMALPRIIIALIIAFTVSKPIELRLFEGRIGKQLAITQEDADKEFDREEQKRIGDLTKQLANINKQEENDKDRLFSNNPLYTDTKSRIAKLENDISAKKTQVETNRGIISRNLYRETRYRTTANPQTKLLLNHILFGCRMQQQGKKQTKTEPLIKKSLFQKKN